MLVIGLGKHEQALEIHNYGTKGYKRLLPHVRFQVWEYSSRNCDCGKIDVLIIDEFGKDISGVGLSRCKPAQIIRIKNTLKLDEIWVSHAILEG
jgi:hypothetical protein